MCNCKHNVNIDHCRICTTRSVFDDHSASLDEMSEVWERGTSTLLDLLLIARGLSDGGASRGVTPRLVIKSMKRLTKDFGWAGAA